MRLSNPTGRRGFRLWHALVLVIAVACARALASVSSLDDRLRSGDNDDLMRLTELRDWLGGQGWFDLHQYRLLPPDGVLMHWSSYVDAGLAAIFVPLSWIMPPHQAELWMMALWPTLLFVVLCLVIGRGTDRLFGPVAAFFALATALVWGRLGGFEFSAGRIDHHNVQMLLCTIAAYLMFLPTKRPFARGIWTGTALSASLAVGLDMLPVNLLICGMAVVAVIFDLDQARARLGGLCISVVAVSAALFAGQTQPDAWRVPHCDVIALPWMSVIGAGIVASLALICLAPRISSRVVRALVFTAVMAAGLWLVMPLFRHCLAGPYAEVSPEVMAIITSKIGEAQPIWRLLLAKPETFFYAALPALIALLAAAVLLVRDWKVLSTDLRQAVVPMIVIAGTGMMLSCAQNRLINNAAPAVPFLVAFVVSRLRATPSGKFSRWSAVSLIFGCYLIASPASVAIAYRQAFAALGHPRPALDLHPDPCRTTTALAAIRALPLIDPETLIFAPSNLGPLILYSTHYATTSGPYHRSMDAFWNGVGAYRSWDDMITALRRSGANYLAVCRDARPAEVTRQLLAGVLPDWLSAVDLAGIDRDTASVLIFRVDKDRLAPTN